MFSHMNWAVAFKHARARKWECVCLEIKMKKNVTSTSSNIMENVIVQSTPYCILYACLVCLAGVVLLPRFKEKKFCFLCFISTLKLGGKHGSTICIRNAGEAEIQQERLYFKTCCAKGKSKVQTQMSQWPEVVWECSLQRGLNVFAACSFYFKLQDLWIFQLNEMVYWFQPVVTNSVSCL